MKDDMQNQGQKQNKKGYYNKYKEPMHKANTSGMMDDKSSMNSMGNDYQNYAKYRKNQGKKSGYNNYNNKGQNDEIKRENEIKNAINDILDCYEIDHEIQITKKED